jgi:antitoxin CptB
VIETPENRLRRVSMRAHRRGMKEMDIILGGFAEGRLSELSGAELDALEDLMDENDQDLYLWCSNAASPPARHQSAVAAIKAYLS